MGVGGVECADGGCFRSYHVNILECGFMNEVINCITYMHGLHYILSNIRTDLQLLLFVTFLCVCFIICTGIGVQGI